MANTYRAKSGRFVVRWTDWTPSADGWTRCRRSTTGTQDRRETLRLGRRLEDAARARMLGGGDPAAERARAESARPLHEHLDDFRRALEARGRTPKHITDQTRLVETTAAGAGWTALRDVDAAGLEARLAELAKEGAADRTVNKCRGACRAFIRWCAADGRLARDPLTRVKPRREVEQSVRRRPLSSGELLALYIAAERGPARVYVCPRRKQRVAWGGVERMLTWKLAADCGLRAGEIVYVIRHPLRCLELDGESPCIRLPASASKHREADHLPLHAALAAELRPYVDRVLSAITEEPGALGELWPAPAALKPALMADLALARARYIDAAGDDAEERQRRERSEFCRSPDARGRVVDVHALRHTYVTHLAAAGTAPKMLQRLARHRDISTTLNVYTHVEEADARLALERYHAVATAESVASAPAVSAVATPASGARGAKRMARPTADGERASRARSAAPAAADSATGGGPEIGPNSVIHKGIGNAGGGTRTHTWYHPKRILKRTHGLGSETEATDAQRLTPGHGMNATARSARTGHNPDLGDLAELVALWPSLSRHAKAGLLTLARELAEPDSLSSHQHPEDFYTTSSASVALPTQDPPAAPGSSEDETKPPTSGERSTGATHEPCPIELPPPPPGRLTTHPGPTSGTCQAGGSASPRARGRDA